MSSPVTLNLTSPTPNSLAQTLSIASTFPQAIAAYQLGLQADYLFGTAATGTLPQIPIRNLTDLATYFVDQTSTVGIAVQNAEVERFQSFNTINHAFETNSLDLTAALEAGGTCVVVEKTLIGAVTGTNVLTFSDTTGIIDSMMYSTSTSGLAAQPASNIRVVSHDSTTVTLSTNVTLPNGADVRFIPFFIVPTVSAASNTHTLTFPAVPAAIQPGMFYANINNGYLGGIGTTRVVSTTATTITLDNSVTVTAAAFIYFQPPITSGQIATKASFGPGYNGASVLGFELTCQIPPSADFGAWPAFWLYPFTGGNGDECDIFEFFNSLTANAGAYTSNIHFGAYNVNGFMRTVGGTNKWSGGFYRPGTDFSLAFHKFQLIWTKDAVYRFIDDQLTIVTAWLPTSLQPWQLIMDLACGSTLSSFLQIYFYPQSTGQFPFSYKLQELKLWQA